MENDINNLEEYPAYMDGLGHCWRRADAEKCPICQEAIKTCGHIGKLHLVNKSDMPICPKCNKPRFSMAKGSKYGCQNCSMNEILQTAVREHKKAFGDK